MKITVIIPTYNEAASIVRVIRTIQDRSLQENIAEILIVDGISTDATVSKAGSCGARVLKCPEKGRGAQLEHGAANANSDILYFLHADSLPPEGFDTAILHAVEAGNEAGCFQMEFDRKELVFRIYGWFTRFSNILCRGGDQSLFITRRLYAKVGGFNSRFKIFEDIDMVERISKVSHFKIIPQKVVTSARRYEQNGFLRLQLLFAILHLKYRFGAPQEGLLNFYERHIR